MQETALPAQGILIVSIALDVGVQLRRGDPREGR